MQTVSTAGRMRNALWVLPALLAGALLRFWMLKRFYEVTGDALIYGGIAKNLLLSGRYALTVGTGETYPTLIRLPGYPLFLAVCFKLFGMENYAVDRMGPDCSGVAGLPAAGGRCAAGGAGAVERGCGALHALAGRVVSVYGCVCGEPADRGADAVCDRAGDVVRSEVCGAAGVAGGVGIYICGDVCGAAATGWRAGGAGVCAGTAADPAAQKESHVKCAAAPSGWLRCACCWR